MISITKQRASFDDVPMILGLTAEPMRHNPQGKSFLALREICNDLEQTTGCDCSELRGYNNLAEYAVRLSEMKAVMIQEVSERMNAAILNAIGYAVDDDE